MSKSLKKLIDINRLQEFKNKLVGTGSAYVQTGAVDQTVAGTKTFSKPIAGSVTGSSGSCTGNAASANIATKATQDAAGNTITTTYATKAENNTKANNSEVVHKSGDETIAGTKTFSNGVLLTDANAFMAQNGEYTLVLRNDSRDTYLLMSDKGGVPGTWSDARPLTISNSTGVCSINGNAATATTATTATNATYTNWLRTSSHSDHLFHTEWDGAYFWTYVTAGDGGYRPVRVARSDSAATAESCTGNAATATTAANGVDSQDANWIRFKNGVQICWGYATSGFAFPKPFSAAPAVSLIHQTFTNRKILINVGAMDSRNCYYNAYDVEGGMYIDASVSYTAFGYWIG